MLDAFAADAPRIRVRGLQILFGATTAFAVSGSMITADDPARLRISVATAALAAVTGVLLTAAEQLSEWAWQCVVAILVVAVASLAYVGGGGGLTTAAALLLVWTAAQAALFANRIVQHLHVALAVGAFSAALLFAGTADPLLPIAALTVSLVAVTQTVGWLGAKARRLARTDELTGCANVRWWEHTVEHELARAGRHGDPLCVAVLGLDGFREFAFERGHAAADLLLHETACAWNDALRDGDLIGRLGPDTFGLLLPDCGAGAARVVVARLQAVVPDGKTCSAGLALWDGAESGPALINRAAQALRLTRNTSNSRSFISAA